MEHVSELDGDICPSEKIPQYFSTTYKSVTSAKVADEGVYCIHLAQDAVLDKLSVSLSDNTIVILKRETLQTVASFKPHDQPITGLRFSPTDSNLIWTSSLDGMVKLWDIRSEKCEKNFKTLQEDIENSDACTKPLTSFDVSINERILCAGTELVKLYAFLLFWDIRCAKSLGGYMDSHNDDITQVKFNPAQADTLATSSTDGLINVFDVSQNNEDDALTYCMNNDVTIDKLVWLKANGRYERLSSITDIHSIHYWDIREASPLHSFSREDITVALKRKLPEEIYLISVDMLNEGDDPIVLAGSGLDNTNCLRTLKLDLARGRLHPEGNFSCKQKQCMSRASLYEAHHDSYITAGECGIVRVWKPEDNSMVTKESVTKHRKHKKKPY